ncbi:MAG: tripartite tricarboxylate transporter substrate binding protein [Proteobacteria bacterium]|nr:tripartite tricarboxylate transporter substrate binding protein [Burkholderiales bacterium]
MTFFLAALLICVGWIAAPTISIGAEAYPSRPIRMIVPTGAGGVTDTLGRVLGQRLTERLGQQVLIDNRPGASGIVGSQIVAKAAPDGYSLLMVFPSHVVNPSLYATMPYDTIKAFAPITMVSSVSTTLLVPGNSRAKSVQDLIALSKEPSSNLNYGSVGRGSLGHLASELLASTSGMNITHVAYKGSPQIMAALLSGEIQMYLIASVGSALPHLQTGRLRALGVSTAKRLPSLPDVPAIAEAVPSYEALGWNGVVAPAGTPGVLIAQLHREIVQIVNTAEFLKLLANEGAVPVGNTPAEFAAAIRADIAKWAKVVQTAGIRPE